METLLPRQNLATLGPTCTPGPPRLSDNYCCPQPSSLAQWWTPPNFAERIIHNFNHALPRLPWLQCGFLSVVLLASMVMTYSSIVSIWGKLGMTVKRPRNSAAAKMAADEKAPKKNTYATVRKLAHPIRYPKKGDVYHLSDIPCPMGCEFACCQEGPRERQRLPKDQSLCLQVCGRRAFGCPLPCPPRRSPAHPQRPRQ